jgi:hypothetical protein
MVSERPPLCEIERFVIGAMVVCVRSDRAWALGWLGSTCVASERVNECHRLIATVTSEYR